MSVIIRPHHGMCLQFYEGKGYSAAFTDHMSGVLKSLTDDPLQTIELRSATDAVCVNCPKNDSGTCADRSKTDRYDGAVLKACGLRDGDTLPWADFAGAVRTKIIQAGLRGAICGDCCWDELCRSKEGAAGMEARE